MRKRCDNEGKFIRPRAEESSGILKNNNQITQLSLSYFLSYSDFIKKNLGVTHSYTGVSNKKRPKKNKTKKQKQTNSLSQTDKKALSVYDLFIFIHDG